MAVTTATNNFYDQVSELIADGTLDLDNDSFEMLLTTSAHTPDAGDSTQSDIDNEVTGNGYSRQALTNVTWTRSSGITTFDFDDPSFAASGGSIVARNWHVRDTTADRLIAYGLLDETPADVTTTDGNTLTANINASDGLFRVGPGTIS